MRVVQQVLLGRLLCGDGGVPRPEKRINLGYFFLCFMCEYVHLFSSSPSRKNNAKPSLHFSPVIIPNAQPSLFWLPKSCPFFKVQFKSYFLVKHSLTISSGSNHSFFKLPQALFFHTTHLLYIIYCPVDVMFLEMLKP